MLDYSDMLLSTLRDYVEKIGELVLTAHFPDRDPVRIKGFADIAGAPRNKRPTARRPSVAARRGKVASART